MRRILKLFMVIIPVFLFLNLTAQETSVLFKEKSFLSKKKILSIYFSNQEGDKEVTPQDAKDSDYLFFTYKPAGEWTLKEEDLKEGIKKIEIKQATNNINHYSLEPQLYEEDIQFVVASFPKSQIAFYEPIQFQYKHEISDEILIPEKYWADYQDYQNYYKKGEELCNNKKFLDAFELIKHFITDDELVKHLSSYESSLPLMKMIVTDYKDRYKNTFNILELEIKKTPAANAEIISKLDSLSKAVDTGKSSFSPYFQSIDQQNIKSDYDSLSSIINDQLVASKNEYLLTFSKLDYTTYKFELFFQALTDLLLTSNKIQDITKIDTIDISLVLSDNSGLITDESIELEELGWKKDFIVFLKLINENISEKNYIFTEEIMNNLERLKDREPQPFYHIFNAFDNLYKQDYDLFGENLLAAIKKTTTAKLLSNLESKYLSYLAHKNRISGKILKSLKEGIELEQDGKLDSAEHAFELLTKKTNDFAPPYFYLGKIYYDNDQFATAEIFLNKALTYYPGYIAPSQYKILHYLKNGDIENANTEIQVALKNNKIWYFYFLKSQILFQLGKFEDAKITAKENCWQINPHSYELCILLGDIYKSLRDNKKALFYYKAAGEIDYKNPIFSKRIDSLK